MRPDSSLRPYDDAAHGENGLLPLLDSLPALPYPTCKESFTKDNVRVVLMKNATRPFRFGVQVAETPSAPRWAEQARRVEALGYDVLVMPDHIGIQLAYAPALAAAACATSRLRIGTLVLATDFRQAATVASETATLDLLSGGRYELGLGVGGSLLNDYALLGQPFETPGVRVGRFAESLAAIKRLLSAGPVTVTGQHVRLNGLVGFPRPVQQPAPPILVGAGGKRMLALAARQADIVSVLVAMSPTGVFDLSELRAEAIDAKIAWIREAAGDRFDQLELHALLQHLAITDNAAEAQAGLSRRWKINPEEVAASPYALLGTVDAIVAQLVTRRDRFGFSYYTVFDRDMEAFAPIIAALREKR